MSLKSNKAKAIFLNGANCAQSVIAVFCEEYGLSAELAFAITDGFGGGMRCGEICGALSGGIAVVGLANRIKYQDEKVRKALSREKTSELVNKFKNAFGDTSCKTLIKGGRVHCAEYVNAVVEILEEMGY